MYLSDLKPLTCKSCGAPIDRTTMKCGYCGTQYESPDGRLKIVVDRPGVHTIRCQVELDAELAHYDPEAASKYTLQQMRHQLADGLLAYMKLMTHKDYSSASRCQIIRGEVKVLDPRFSDY